MFLSEQWFLQRDLEKKTAEWWKQFIVLKLEISYNCCINSSVVSEGVINNFKEMFPLARMFSLAVNPCSDERQNGFKNLKLKRYKFLQPSFTPCGHVCFCLKTLKHFRFKCFRRFLKIKFFWFLKTVFRTFKTSFKY